MQTRDSIPSQYPMQTQCQEKGGASIQPKREWGGQHGRVGADFVLHLNPHFGGIESDIASCSMLREHGRREKELPPMADIKKVGAIVFPGENQNFQKICERRYV